MFIETPILVLLSIMFVLLVIAFIGSEFENKRLHQLRMDTAQELSNTRRMLTNSQSLLEKQKRNHESMLAVLTRREVESYDRIVRLTAERDMYATAVDGMNGVLEEQFERYAQLEQTHQLLWRLTADLWMKEQQQ